MKGRYYVLTALYCGAIFWMSSQPVNVPTRYLFPGWDKFAHGMLDGGLAALISAGMHYSDRAWRPSVHFFVPVAFCIAYGLSDEIHQYFVPNRSCDPIDWITDAAGALAVQTALFAGVWRIPLRSVFERK